MNFSIFRNLILFQSIIIPLSLSAQTKLRPHEDAKPDLSWWKFNKYEADTTAPAVILFDYGKSTTDPYSGTKLYRKRRIKIFKKSAIDEWGSLSIVEERERMTDFKCVVYNLVDGKIQQSLVEKNDILKYKFDSRTKVNSIPIPNVYEGSVIEYSYTIKSPIYAIPHWVFQYSIPVEWSEYEIFFPGTFYGVLAEINGLLTLDDISIHENGRRRKYILTSIPAFKPEPFMPPEYYYRSSIRFRQGNSGKFIEAYTKDRLMKYGIVRDSASMDSKIVTSISMKADDKEHLTGSITIKKSGHIARLGWRRVDEVGNERFLNEEEDRAWIIHKKELREKIDSMVLEMEYDVSIQSQIQNMNNLLVINPFSHFAQNFNQLQPHTRIYPVDFTSRMDKAIMFSLELPKGYSIEQLPQSTVIELPNKSAVFAFSVSRIGESILLVSRLRINKVIFNVDEYDALREFLERVEAKNSELIILKWSG